ncbi:CYTH domain-containing protein [Paracrocinitomix mangrovi]|uniref:CYTH domain-containing protein n=1 Tax=Paracrocinitomix mangrovi TaxID=2862509 RepID=UPI001C8DFAA1|nr:CYTH domain-containing protein [Paracrocinitomix mangrovi]UKN02494.1 CYTH domain-containing protein [Paracrocinitomix mangrovi]
MPLEIEHKYLINQEEWSKVTPDQSIHIQQAFIFSTVEKSVRVRIYGEQGFLTIKGKTMGATRKEFEYEIPKTEAQELINDFGENLIEKIRYIVTINDNCWEVDEFLGANKGLFVAEIELSNESENYSKPSWLGIEVTEDPKYLNVNLAKNPFSKW